MNIGALTAGLLRALILLAGGALVAAGLVNTLSGPVYYLTPWTSLVWMVAAVAGGYRAAKKAKCRGWLHGLGVGGILGTGAVVFMFAAGSYPAWAGLPEFISTAGYGFAGGLVAGFRRERPALRERGI
ncbi:MAG: TIGR04086 family membrane protein [Heliobacteriaceae bacterium]|nr:TIGR04086 family membrane protein [Heliobacteriaceae bacterium]MDD4586941.1 TIGR04086 family membrane protein [Heliobacteriaceae bacterium]